MFAVQQLPVYSMTGTCLQFINRHMLTVTYVCLQYIRYMFIVYTVRYTVYVQYCITCLLLPIPKGKIILSVQKVPCSDRNLATVQRKCISVLKCPCTVVEGTCDSFRAFALIKRSQNGSTITLNPQRKRNSEQQSEKIA